MQKMSRLEQSKQRLALAFNHLEAVVTARLNEASETKVSLQAYRTLRAVSHETLDQLSASINFLETLLPNHADTHTDHS